MNQGIGGRIKELREGREPRLSQRELAERAGVSVDTISKLEQGRRQTALVPTLLRIAAGLDVDLAQLFAPPPRIDGDGLDAEAAGVLAIRHAVITSRPAGEPLSVDDLEREMGSVWAHYWNSRFEVLGRTLPALIQAARVTVDIEPSPTAWAALADLLGAGASMLVHLGQLDLAYLLMKQAENAAVRSGDELRHAAVVGWTSWLLLHQAGGNDEAQHLAISQAAAVEPSSFSKASPTRVAVWGSLLVSGAVAAARENDAGQADDILNLAEVAALRLEALPGQTTSPYERNFGRELVAMQGVDIAVVTGRPGLALERAGRMEPLRAMPLAARARHAADRAYAYTQLGHSSKAEATLLSLEREAPQWMRYQPYPRVIVRELWEQNKRRSGGLRGLAGRLSVSLD